MGVNTMKKAIVKKGISTPKTKRTTSSSLLWGKSTPKAKNATSGKKSDIDKAIEDLARTQKESILAMERTTKETRLELRQTTKETRRELRQTTTETRRELRQTAKGLADSMEEMRLELRKTITDLADSMEKTTQETRLELRKTTTDLAKSVKDLSGNVGGINRSLGRIVEMVLLPGLMDKMNEMYGYQFDNVASDKIFKEHGQQYAEVDLFIENGDSVMAVEAKARVKEGDVNKLLATLTKLRAHEVKAGLVGKTIYGAIAGIVFDDNARRVAEESGLYLVDIDQDNDRIKIELHGVAAGRW